MLHILLMILKIVGILIAIILILLLLAMLILVFAPLQYRLDGSCKGTLETAEVNLRFTWLYRVFGGYVSYREGKSDWQVRILWKKLNVKKESENVKNDLPQKKEMCQEKSQEESNHAEEKKDHPAIVSEEISEQKDKPESQAEKKSKVEESVTKEKNHGWIEKIKKIFYKIKYTFRKFCDKIKIIAEKKEKLIEFLADEIHQNAFVKLKEELMRLLRFLKPKYLSGCVRFGFEDPSLTGKVLAWLSMFYGMYGEHLILQPDFQEKVLEGELHVRGKVRASYFLIVLFHIWRSKEIRTTYQHVRKFKL